MLADLLGLGALRPRQAVRVVAAVAEADRGSISEGRPRALPRAGDTDSIKDRPLVEEAKGLLGAHALR